MVKSAVLVTIVVSILKIFWCEIVEIEDGKIKGTILQTRSGINFFAFRKIPYAQQPVGALRFRAPKPVKQWRGILDCINYGPVCWQVTNVLPTAEDCLYLNVFTKNLPSDEHSNLKPVIVWIQGGGNLAGSPRDYGPEYLLDRDVIFVKINFRLGALGFLALETDDIHGNAGFKDQNLAPRWIKRNIRWFGGDPQRITMAGISSRAYAITAHMLSPMSKGLFQNVILTSGALTFNQKMKTNNFDLAEQIATRVNCTMESIQAMAQCLENTPASALASASNFSHFYCPIQVWRPVIERKLGRKRVDRLDRETFLTGQPDKLLREGKFAKVSILLGTSDELFASATSILNDANATQFFNEHFNGIAPICYAFEDANGHTAAEISQMIRDFYFPYPTIDIRSKNLLHHSFVDGLVGHRVHKMARYTRNSTCVYTSPYGRPDSYAYLNLNILVDRSKD